MRRGVAWRVCALLGVAWAPVLGLTGAQQESPPPFRAAADLVMLDVQVAQTKRAATVPRLSVADFHVKINGRPRTVVLAEFLHDDDGRVVRRAEPPRLDAATVAACLFGFERASNAATAHYVLGVEPVDADQSGIKRPQITVSHADVATRKWAWRSRPTTRTLPAERRP